MKLRIAQYTSNVKMNGEFIIEKRNWRFKWVIATEISDGCFYDKADALAIIKRHLGRPARRLLHTYGVDGRELP